MSSISPRTLAVLRIVFSSLGVTLVLMSLQETPWMGGPGPAGFGLAFGLAAGVGLCTPLSVLGLWLVLLNLRGEVAWACSEGGLQVTQCALLCLLWTPCGRQWSMDAYFGWWRGQSLWIGPIRVLQLLQIVIYLESGLYKLMGTQWWDGSALLKVTQNQNFSPWFAWAADPHPMVAGVMMLVTWLVLFWELTFPLWLLWPTTRLLAFSIGIAMHGTLWLFFDVGLYPPAMLALYLTYLPDRQATPFEAPSIWKKAWVALHSGLILWAAVPDHKVYPEQIALRSPMPGLQALESAAYELRRQALAALPAVRVWQRMVDALGLNHRYNTFAPTPPNYCILFRLRDKGGTILWSDIPGEGRRYSWTVVMVRSLATTSPQALPYFFQRASDRLGVRGEMVLEEWLVELGQPCARRTLNRTWNWLPLQGGESQQGGGIHQE